MTKKRKVIIKVKGGVAEVIKKPVDVIVEIQDEDNLEEKSE